jgi:hypothetical protein
MFKPGAISVRLFVRLKWQSPAKSATPVSDGPNPDLRIL